MRETRSIQFTVGHQALAAQLGDTLQLPLRITHRHRCLVAHRFRAMQIGLRLRNLGLKQRRFDLCDDLTFFYTAIEVGVQALDHARHLAADQHRHHRIECAGRRHRNGQIAALHFGDREFGRCGRGTFCVYHTPPAASATNNTKRVILPGWVLNRFVMGSL